MASKPEAGNFEVANGAVAAEDLAMSFPSLDLPIVPPFPVMEAKPAKNLPKGDGWQYEPKWDGFRCLAFRSDETVALQSKAGQPLGRYFPELVEMFLSLPQPQFVVDGEIVILRERQLFFDDLLLRIHPAASRIRKLASETPTTFIAFDLLLDKDKEGRELQSLADMPLSERRARLESFWRQYASQQFHLSPVTEDYELARRWLSEPKATALDASGFDGVVAKLRDASYAAGERTAMVKVKRMRTADCVVGGFRWASKGGEVGSLLLGLYDSHGLLNHVGFSSSFAADERRELKPILQHYQGGSGFTGHAPGGPSRWSTERSGEWERLEPKLVCEVRYDHFSGGRFRHGTKFLRWRPEKAPRQCTYEQLDLQPVSRTKQPVRS